MQKILLVLMVSAAVVVTGGCATKNYVKNSVKTSSDQLTTRIEGTEGEVKEVRDDVDKKVSGVDSKVSALDSKTTEQFSSVRNDVQGVDQKASAAQTASQRNATDIAGLDQKFQNRNDFNTMDTKSVQFKVNSATLDPMYTEMLDEIANTLMQNANAIVVLEGRTDSTGAKDYNVQLGERRIEAVRRYLAVEKGVPVYRIHDISFGAEKPIAENKTREGREKNRAVVMTIMTPKADGAVASRN
jgi:outer membrane protein OmpA-like peptidoglycan-associated protein